MEKGARGFSGGEQVGVIDPASAGPLKLGDERTARIAGDRRQRAGARTKTKPVQCESGFRLRINRHGSNLARLEEAFRYARLAHVHVENEASTFIIGNKPMNKLTDS